MLDQEKPDLAVITCENAQHLEVCTNVLSGRQRKH